MQPKSVAISTAFHIAVFMATMVSLPWLKRDFEIPQPISVEMVDVSELTQTNKVVKQPAPPKEEPKKEEPPQPPKPVVAQNTSAEPVTPVKEKPPEKEEPKKEDKVLVDENAPPEKKKTPKEEKKKETTKAEPKKDFASVLKNLEDTKDKTPVKAPTPDLKPAETTPETGAIAPLGAKLTMSEEDALRRQLEGCWNPPIGAKDAENLKVDIYMVVNPDRTLREAKIVDQSRYNSDSFFHAAADSALRAVRNPLCSPFQLPEDKYDTWKTITVTFDPSQMM